MSDKAPTEVKQEPPSAPEDLGEVVNTDHSYQLKTDHDDDNVQRWQVRGNVCEAEGSEAGPSGAVSSADIDNSKKIAVVDSSPTPRMIMVNSSVMQAKVVNADGSDNKIFLLCPQQSVVSSTVGNVVLSESSSAGSPGVVKDRLQRIAQQLGQQLATENVGRKRRSTAAVGHDKMAGDSEANVAKDPNPSVSSPDPAAPVITCIKTKPKRNQLRIKVDPRKPGEGREGEKTQGMDGANKDPDQGVSVPGSLQPAVGGETSRPTEDAPKDYDCAFDCGKRFSQPSQLCKHYYEFHKQAWVRLTPEEAAKQSALPKPPRPAFNFFRPSNMKSLLKKKVPPRQPLVVAPRPKPKPIIVISPRKRRSVPTETLQCKFCDEKFSKPNDLFEHYQTHTEVVRIKKRKRVGSGAGNRQDDAAAACQEDKSPARKGTQSKTMQCKYCKERFLKPTELFEHYKTHTDIVKKSWKDRQECDASVLTDFVCVYCCERYKYKSELEKHMRLHSKEHQCHFCGHAFVDVQNLRTHERTHTGEKPYLCKTCGKTFARHDNFRDHGAVHSDERPHRCNRCGKTFKLRRHLLRHKKIHQGGKKYKCRFCGLGFNLTYIRKRHEARHSNDNSLMCGFCGKIFFKIESLEEHEEIHIADLANAIANKAQQVGSMETEGQDGESTPELEGKEGRPTVGMETTETKGREGRPTSETKGQDGEPQPEREGQEGKPTMEAEGQDSKPIYAETEEHEGKPTTEAKGQEDKPTSEDGEPQPETEGEKEQPTPEMEGQGEPTPETEGRPIAEMEVQERIPTPESETQGQKEKHTPETKGQGAVPTPETEELKEKPTPETGREKEVPTPETERQKDETKVQEGKSPPETEEQEGKPAPETEGQEREHAPETEVQDGKPTPETKGQEEEQTHETEVQEGKPTPEMEGQEEEPTPETEGQEEPTPESAGQEEEPTPETEGQDGKPTPESAGQEEDPNPESDRPELALLEKKFKCKVCNKKFVLRSSLARHKERFHSDWRDPNEHVCQHCGKGFPTRHQVTSHERVHMDFKPYCCQYCGKTYKSKGHWEYHENNHRNNYWPRKQQYAYFVKEAKETAGPSEEVQETSGVSEEIQDSSSPGIQVQDDDNSEVSKAVTSVSDSAETETPGGPLRKRRRVSEDETIADDPMSESQTSTTVDASAEDTAGSPTIAEPVPSHPVTEGSTPLIWHNYANPEPERKPILQPTAGGSGSGKTAAQSGEDAKDKEDDILSCPDDAGEPSGEIHVFPKVEVTPEENSKTPAGKPGSESTVKEEQLEMEVDVASDDGGTPMDVGDSSSDGYEPPDMSDTEAHEDDDTSRTVEAASASLPGRLQIDHAYSFSQPVPGGGGTTCNEEDGVTASTSKDTNANADPSQREPSPEPVANQPSEDTPKPLDCGYGCGKQFSDPSGLCQHYYKAHKQPQVALSRCDVGSNDGVPSPETLTSLGCQPFGIEVQPKKFLLRQRLLRKILPKGVELKEGEKSQGEDGTREGQEVSSPGPAVPAVKIKRRPRTVRQLLRRKREKAQETNETREAETSDSKEQVCVFCSKTFPSITALKIHFHQEHEDKTIQTPAGGVCHHCGKSFKRKPMLRRHILVEHTAELTCQFCDRKFSTRHYRILHERTHTGEKPFECKKCGKRFRRVHHLADHMASLIHTEKKNYICETCGKAFVTSTALGKHKLRHLERKPYVCSVCGKDFVSRYLMRQHMIRHTGQKPYICQFCGKRFAVKISLTMHEKRHGYDYDDDVVPEESTSTDNKGQPHRVYTYGKDLLEQPSTGKTGGQRVFKCYHCKKRFHRLDELTEHYKTHPEGPPELECKHCEQRFAKKVNLDNHCRRRHPDKRDPEPRKEKKRGVGCKCGERFSQVSELFEHYKSHPQCAPKATEKEVVVKQPRAYKFECQRCERLYETPESLNRHEKRCSNTPKSFPFGCFFCDKRFSLQDSLDAHILRVHRDIGEAGYDPLKCKYCSETYPSVPCLFDHYKTHDEFLALDDNDRKRLEDLATCDLRCEHCELVFLTKTLLRLHEATHLDGQYKCKFCGKIFMKLSNLVKHERVQHLNGKQHECNICGKRFNRRAHLQGHLRIHSEERNFKCDVCDLTMKTIETLNKHKKTHWVHKPHTCVYCGKGFVDRKGWLNHEEVCTFRGERLFMCRHCESQFATKSLLDNHEKDHQNATSVVSQLARPRCQYCRKGFKSIQALQQHELTCALEPRDNVYPSGESGSALSTVAPVIIFEGEDAGAENPVLELECEAVVIPNAGKEYDQLVCQHCGFQFYSVANLNKHYETKHKETRPVHVKAITARTETVSKNVDVHVDDAQRKYQCVTCKMYFVGAANYENHRKNHAVPESETKQKSKDLRYRCRHCKKRFKRFEDLTEHYKTHPEGVPDEPYKCQYCERSFTRLCDRAAHYKSHPEAAQGKPSVPTLTGKPGLGCTRCGERFARAAELFQHYRSSPVCLPEETPPTKRVSNKVPKMNMVQYHILKLKCQYCDKLFDSKESLQNHMAICAVEICQLALNELQPHYVNIVQSGE